MRACRWASASAFRPIRILTITTIRTTGPTAWAFMLRRAGRLSGAGVLRPGAGSGLRRSGPGLFAARARAILLRPRADGRPVPVYSAPPTTYAPAEIVPPPPAPDYGR